jgi:hypothetical protein
MARWHSGANMGVQTIGEAYQAGWRIHVRCAWGRREAMKSVRGCLGKSELDLDTLIWMGSRHLPLVRQDARTGIRSRSWRSYRAPPIQESQRGPLRNGRV